MSLSEKIRAQMMLYRGPELHDLLNACCTALEVGEGSVRVASTRADQAEARAAALEAERNRFAYENRELRSTIGNLKDQVAGEQKAKQRALVALTLVRAQLQAIDRGVGEDSAEAFKWAQEVARMLLRELSEESPLSVVKGEWIAYLGNTVIFAAPTLKELQSRLKGMDGAEKMRLRWRETL